MVLIKKVVWTHNKEEDCAYVEIPQQSLKAKIDFGNRTINIGGKVVMIDYLAQIVQHYESARRTTRGIDKGVIMLPDNNKHGENDGR